MKRELSDNKPSTIPESPKPKPKPQNFIDELLNPSKPLKPVVPQKYEPEESEMEKIMRKRRQDIEYSEDDESDTEWGEGVKRQSKKNRRIEILEFLRNLE